MLKNNYREKFNTVSYIHIIAIVFVLHHPALSDGCPCTVWISNIPYPWLTWSTLVIIFHPEALIPSVDQLASCSASHSSLAFHFCASASEPQMSAVQRQLCYAFWCLLILWYTLTVASFNLLFYSSSCLGWVLAGIGSYCANKVNRAIYSLWVALLSSFNHLEWLYL